MRSGLMFREEKSGEAEPLETGGVGSASKEDFLGKRYYAEAVPIFVNG